MAEGKKSFKLYTDQKVFFDQLPDELAGKMIKHLFAYVNDENPTEDDLLLKLAFAPIKRQLKHDLKLYEKIVKRNTLNGKKGGRPKKPTGLNGLNKKPRKADKDKDKDINILFTDFWSLYDKKENKMVSEKLWNKLKDSEREIVMTHVPKYKLQAGEKKFMLHPDKYLRHKKFLDDDGKPMTLKEKYNYKPM